MILLSSSLQSFFQLLGVLLIFVFVLFITYFVTKWIGNFQKIRTHGGSLQVVESIQIAANKYIQIIKAGDVYLVIAVGKDEVTMLTQLTGEQLGITENETDEGITSGKVTAGSIAAQETFQEVMNRLKGHFPKKQD